jgi:alkylated DNA repair dioxygenase AlkB
MESLFPSQPKLPGGFTYVPDFINFEEEKNLIHEISRIPLRTFLFQGYEAKRKVASFGYHYSFDKRTVSKGAEIPREFEWLIERVSNRSGGKKIFSALLITEYPVGSVINWHRDAPPFETIAGVSLLSDCVFRFRPHDKNLQGRKSIISLNATRRSLYVMEGDSRSQWEHSILPVTATRYSITLRTLKQVSE